LTAIDCDRIADSNVAVVIDALWNRIE
jgi:hypothetical protein